QYHPSIPTRRSSDLRVPLVLAHVGRHYRPDRVEVRVGRGQLLVLVEDVHELAEVGVPPDTARPSPCSRISSMARRALVRSVTQRSEEHTSELQSLRQ